jgi:hypothetical protein
MIVDSLLRLQARNNIPCLDTTLPADKIKLAALVGQISKQSGFVGQISTG